ncbi:hypothetical protein M408DRAFT_31317 [Serendipita vermifera MAFF 305830]|uniref:Uncharacterized protein n=1 Tax=Serendipita vermifera MAFF 305830 TaxID=933852 RepID=A0A0C3AGW4_SERVB|nr:hypothetical protein M408DRAFT_31317 [Serendipita vermifera MAFF 305830]
MADAHRQPLALPAPEDAETTTLEVGSSVKLDKLGPMIINSDGVCASLGHSKSILCGH